MRSFIAASVAALLTLSASAQADSISGSPPVECSGGTCVNPADLTTLLQVARERKCLIETTPTVTSDPITIVVDRQGRVYGSGSDPRPYTVHLNWCNFAITAQSQTKMVVAERVEPTWGFRFRAKATLGVLGTELLVGEQFTHALDGGILLEPFYIQWLNIHGYIGVRSVGAGLGADITRNFGLGLGYAITWGEWRSNPFASLYFSFW